MGGSCFRRSKRMGAFALKLKSMGAPRIKRSNLIKKCGSSSFKHWKHVGALAFKAQQNGSSRFKLSKVIESFGSLALSVQNVHELSLYTSISVGAPVLGVQKWGSYRWKQTTHVFKCKAPRLFEKLVESSTETAPSSGSSMEKVPLSKGRATFYWIPS